MTTTYDDDMRRIHAARDALAELNTMTDSIVDDDEYDRNGTTLRSLLINRDASAIDELDPDIDTTPELARRMLTLLDALFDADPYYRDSITELALSYSLCPLHLIDYAICFDDDDAECAQIRMIHPSHDT